MRSTDATTVEPTLRRTGRDRNLLFFFVGLTLLSPYLPQFGPIVGQVRFDNLLVPLVTFWVAWRELGRGRLSLAPPLLVYLLFLFWMWAVSLVVIIDPVAKYTVIGSFAIDLTTDILTGVETYLRPFMFLYVAMKIDVGRDDLVDLLKVLFIVTVPLVFIALLQIFPPTSTITNDLVYFLYTNQRVGAATGLKAVLSGGRAMSIFGQVGTFGQYCLVILALLVARVYGMRIPKSRRQFAALIILVVLGGLASGSKVFSGGLLILAPLVMFFTPLKSRILRPRMKHVLAVVGSVVGLFGLFYAFSKVLSRYATVRLLAYFDMGSLIETYMAGRFFGGAGGELPKVIRSGAVSIVSDFPITGLGLTKMGATVDSFWIGLMVLSGAVGVGLFVWFLVLVLRRVLELSRHHPDPVIQGISRMLVFLGIAFAAAAIGFHTFIQDRAGDLYWILVGLMWNGRVVKNRLR